MVVELVTEVKGVTYWRQSLPNCRPAFEVYRVVGRVQQTGRYVFKAVRGGAIIYRAYSALNQGGFEPFLYDRAQLEKYEQAGLERMAKEKAHPITGETTNAFA
jgi:hypothetical protein